MKRVPDVAQSPIALSDDEQRLIETCRAMTSEGQRMLFKVADVWLPIFRAGPFLRLVKGGEHGKA